LRHHRTDDQTTRNTGIFISARAGGVDLTFAKTPAASGCVAAQPSLVRHCRAIHEVVAEK
jgi:hypothetical protein